MRRETDLDIIKFYETITNNKQMNRDNDLK